MIKRCCECMTQFGLLIWPRFETLFVLDITRVCWFFQGQTLFFLISFYFRLFTIRMLHILFFSDEFTDFFSCLHIFFFFYAFFAFES